MTDKRSKLKKMRALAADPGATAHERDTATRLADKLEASLGDKSDFDYRAHVVGGGGMNPRDWAHIADILGIDLEEMMRNMAKDMAKGFAGVSRGAANVSSSIHDMGEAMRGFGRRQNKATATASMHEYGRRHVPPRPFVRDDGPSRYTDPFFRPTPAQDEQRATAFRVAVWRVVGRLAHVTRDWEGIRFKHRCPNCGGPMYKHWRWDDYRPQVEPMVNDIREHAVRVGASDKRIWCAPCYKSSDSGSDVKPFDFGDAWRNGAAGPFGKVSEFMNHRDDTLQKWRWEWPCPSCGRRNGLAISDEIFFRGDHAEAVQFVQTKVLGLLLGHDDNRCRNCQKSSDLKVGSDGNFARSGGKK
jgi:hypothetical protein